MADNNTVGRLNVEITGNSVPLETSLKQAEVSTKSTAGRMGATLGGLRSAFSKVFVPLTIAASVIRLVEAIDKAKRAAEEMRKEFTGIREDFSKPIDLQAYGLRAGVSEFDKMRAELLEKARQTRQEIDELAESKLADVKRLADRAWLGGLLGGLSDAQIIQEAEKQQRLMTAAVEQGLKNIADEMAKKMAEVLKDFLEKQKEQANKHLESIAIDSARSRQLWESMQAAQPRGAH